MMLPRRALAVLLMSVSLAACGTPPGEATPPATSRIEPTPAMTATPSVEPEPSETPSATDEPTTPPVSPDPPPLALREVATGLADPTNISAVPNGWLLVTERAGRVMAVDPASGELAEALDLRDRVAGGGERGLLGLALHPDWPETPRAFVHYSDRNGDTVVSEVGATAVGGAPILDASTESILLQVDQPYANHNGGQLAFGPDRRLWIGLGDGGQGGDPHGHGQNPTTLLGSILRLDVDEPGTPAIPRDNAFADGSDGAPEVHLYGLRNPWRFSFDRLTAALWIADVGQNAYEEVNRIDPIADAGANLGWNVMEASHCFADARCTADGLVEPVSEYGRELGCSITGGYVYRGSAIPGLVGWYLFGDYCSGIVLGVQSDVSELTTPRRLLGSGAALSSFGEDADGELYVADLAGGTIYRIVPGG